MRDETDLLTVADAADLLGLAAETLDHWRMTPDRGPAFVKLGRAVRYRRADVLAFVQRGRRTSTVGTRGGEAD
ncbi:helix-turn-helix transcriptional regulator [Roseococcus suduntuyensis]|uniref:Excisionase family DNA binding protein n=1 Tax=Roseococcus suduntuyensis TaxID=455361 RepID=A0A840AHE5_9PROT|nr:helix-turn-helix domain-containing protein [Roseococcus suduntuyensis]MBB3900417.1 excisionase family DNA binding protein [Roseococcus suduntuyensis]